MLKLKLQYFAPWCKELTHLKRHRCWERLKAGGEGDDRGWDGWMASLTQWTWVWVDSRSWWWTGRPGVLRFMGSQRVRHDWAIDLIWSDLNCSTPGLPVHQQLPEPTQTHAHCVCDAIQPSHPLSSPSPPTFNLSQHESFFKWVSFLHQVAKILEFELQHQSLQWTPRADLLQDGLVGSLCSPRDSQESSPTPQFKSINSSRFCIKVISYSICLSLSDFTQYDNLYVHPCCCTRHYSILFNSWVIFLSVCISPLYPLSFQWTLRLLPCLDYIVSFDIYSG